MTSRLGIPTPETKIVQFPDPPPEEMTAFCDVNFPAYPASLSLRFQNRKTTIITSELATGPRPTESYAGILFPDLLVAFDVDPQAGIARKGYLIPEQGKPPGFVLEVASETTTRRGETIKRDAYAAMGAPEYWRFDPTGCDMYQEALAGVRFVGGGLPTHVDPSHGRGQLLGPQRSPEPHPVLGRGPSALLGPGIEELPADLRRREGRPRFGKRRPPSRRGVCAAVGRRAPTAVFLVHQHHRTGFDNQVGILALVQL